MTGAGVLKSLLFAVAISAALITIAATLMQRRLMYWPDVRRTDPAAVGLRNVSELVLATPDGQTVIGWSATAAPGRPTVLYFHGNGGSLAARADRFGDLQRRGFGVVMMSYRGYSGSTGAPTERDNVADAVLAYDTLRARGVAATSILLFGESLGTGVATQLATKRPVAGLVLDSPYTSMTAMAELVYPWLPARFLLWDRYATIDHLRHVTAPVLVIHGEADLLVPVEMGRAVHRAATSPAEIVTFPGAGHILHRPFGSFDVVARWIDGLRVRAKSPLQ